MSLFFKLYKYNVAISFFNKKAGGEVWLVKLAHEAIFFRIMCLLMLNLRKDIRKMTGKKKNGEELLFSLGRLLEPFTCIRLPAFRRALNEFIRGELATRRNIHFTDEELEILWPQVGLGVDPAGNLCKDNGAHG